MRLEGKVAVVTGSSRGIGREIAKVFAREGADIVINYVRGANEAATIVKEIESMGRRAMFIMADVSRKDQAEMLIEEAFRSFGRLDILVNNAGIWMGGTIQDTKEEDWDRCMAVNLKGPFNCMQAASRVMMERRYGKVINISSISGLGGAPKGELAYSCSKAGLISMSSVAALDLSPYGINVNCIAPGWTITDMVRRYAGSEERFEEMKEKKAAQAMIGRVGYPEDIANTALFLASDESDFITGQVIVVDGGRKDFLSHA